MDKTKLEIIQGFNEKKLTKVLPETTKVIEDKTVVSSKEADKETVKTNQEVIKEKAEETKEVRAKRKAEEEEAKQQEEENATLLEQGKLLGEELQQGIKSGSQPARDWLSALPTPGGIGMLLLALLFFMLVIIPVNANGDTRLKLLWKTITGQTYLADKIDNSSTKQGVGSTNTTTPALPAPTIISTLPLITDVPSTIITPMTSIDAQFMTLFGFDQ